MIDQWKLHVTATARDVEDALADLCLHKRARPVADRDYPACLIGRGSPDEPPAWLCLVRDELERRGFGTKWCDPWCAHEPADHRANAQAAA